MTDSSAPALILASQSAARKHLLASAGLEFEARAADVCEDTLKSRFSPLRDQPGGGLALHLAIAKALSVSAAEQGALVIGADQILLCGCEVFDKPASPGEAAEQLVRLRGKSHVLISAVACARAGEVLWRHSASARLVMRNFSDDFIAGYVTAMGDEILTSVGGYKIEGRGIQLFESIAGDHATILGLPLLALLGFLRSQGLVPD